MTTFEQVCVTIADYFKSEASEITLETHIVDDLGADSLDVVELIMALEDTFSVSIKEEDSKTIHTVGDIVTLVDQLQK